MGQYSVGERVKMGTGQGDTFLCASWKGSIQVWLDHHIFIPFCS